MRLDGFRPLIKFIPEVKIPARSPVLKERLIWTGIALLIFFVMYHIYPIGIQVQTGAQFEFLQMIMASKMGSMITTGIGPIVLASIFLQLFVGAKVIDVDLSNPADKALFSGVQKILALALCFFEAAIYVLSGNIQVFGSPTSSMLPLFGSLILTQLFVILQIALGSIILLYLDEVVSKHGIGSGISLFIAAGVSLAVVQGSLALIFGWGLPEDSPSVKGILLSGTGGATAIPDALVILLPILFTIIVFLVVTYAEGMKVEIPLSFGRARGFGGRYPIKFLYVSNIPVILASALLLNVQMWARLVLMGKSWMIGGIDVIRYIAYVDGNGTIKDGLLYLLTPLYINPITISGGYATYLNYLGGTTPITNIPEFVHVFTYVIFMVILCVIFGRFWIETTNMGAKDVA
ncbi:MAG: hypothetical protein V1909_00085, partial [Candidatus Micrarchaeota archaeon]